MLDIAKRKSKEANLSIEFIEGDITNINLQKKFDAVISMFAVIENKWPLSLFYIV